MRLAAFGGTRYGERARVGRWPRLPDGDLNDLAALPKGSGWITFGVGQIGEGPCVVVRERQTEADRGGYAYTALFDPGEELWRAFGWNGARIISAILRDTHLRVSLMSVPEELAGQAAPFVQRLMAAAATEIVASRGPHDRVSEALAHSLACDDVVIVRDPTATRRSPAEMAAILAALPICLRGVGWHVGIGAHSASTFGANVVIESHSEASGLVNGTVEASSETLRAITSLATSSAPAVRGLLDTPAWSWPFPKRSVSGQLRALAGLDSTAIRNVDVFAPPLAEVLQEAVFRRLDDGAALTLEDSRLVVRIWFDARRPPSASLRAAVDVAAVMEWLSLRSWSEWFDLVGSGIVEESTTSRLIDPVRAAVSDGDDFALFRYLFLGQDPGGAWLSRTNPSRVGVVVAMAIGELSAEAPRSVIAWQWLTAAANTPARDQLSIEKKLDLARLVGGPWAVLSAVQQLWLTGRRPTAKTHGPVSLEEVGAVITAGEAGADCAVNIGQFLRNFPSPIPAGLVAQILRSPRASSPNVVNANVEWLVQQGHTDLLDSWCQALAREGRWPPIRPSDLPAALLGRFIAWLLSANEPSPGLFVRVLASLVAAEGAAPRREALAAAISDAVEALPKDLGMKTTVFRRLAEDASVFEYVAKSLAPDTILALMDAAYRSKPSVFVATALNVLAGDGGLLRAARKSLREFLASANGREAAADLRAAGSSKPGRIRTLLSKWGLR